MTMRRGTRADPDPEAFTITYGKGVYRRFIGGDANDETVIAEQQQYVAQSPAPCYVHPGFTMEQWIELKIQIMVYKHIILYVALPPELLYKPAVVNTEKVGYLRNVVPEEGGRCKRTDGKKWRCARDVVAPCEKYCDRHLYRGRFRSRKPVEINNINNNNKKMKLKKPRLQPAAAAAAPPTHSPLLLFNAQSQLVNRDLEPITMSNNQMVAMSEADKKWLASSWSIASAVYHHQPPKPHVPPPIPNFPTITPNIDLMNTSWSDIYKNNNNNNSTHDHVYPSRLPRVDEEASCSWWKIDHPEDSSTGQLLQLYPMDWETSSSSSQAYDSPWEFGECSKLGE